MANNVTDNLLKALIDAESELVNQLSTVRSAIQAFRNPSFQQNTSIDPVVVRDVVNKPDSTYSPNGTLNLSHPFLRKEFARILNEQKRFMQMREVADMLFGKEKVTKEITNKISSATATLKRKGHIVKKQIGAQNRNTFWGIPDWLDVNGEIKPEHNINEEYLYMGGETEDLFH